MVLPVVLLQLPIAARSPWAALKVGVQNGVPKQDTLNMPEKADGAATASTATAGYQKPGAVGAELSVLILGGSVTGGGGRAGRRLASTLVGAADEVVWLGIHRQGGSQSGDRTHSRTFLEGRGRAAYASPTTPLKLLLWSRSSRGCANS